MLERWRLIENKKCVAVVGRPYLTRMKNKINYKMTMDSENNSQMCKPLQFVYYYNCTAEL